MDEMQLIGLLPHQDFVAEESDRVDMRSKARFT